MQEKISFIIATKDRAEELKRLLESLRKQTSPVDQIIIVDSSQSGRKEWLEKPQRSSLPVDYYYYAIPSTSNQRNFGLTKVKPEMDWVGFLDDDVILEKTAVEEMRKASRFLLARYNVGGMGFNLVNHPQMEFQPLKNIPLVEKLGLYSQRRGVVLPSGFQTMIGIVENDTEVEWLPSTAAIWRREVIARHRFDEYFSGYGYLEDLDFSYSIGKKYKLLIIAQARYYHLPGQSGRGSPFVFGVREVINRLYFVRKHKELSLLSCYLALILRCQMSLFLALKTAQREFIARATGNIWGMLKSAKLFLVKR
jgi:GT2 family glycosyltransferase